MRTFLYFFVPIMFIIVGLNIGEAIYDGHSLAHIFGVIICLVGGIKGMDYLDEFR